MTFPATALDGSDAETGAGGAADALRGFIAENRTVPSGDGGEIEVAQRGWRQLAALPGLITFAAADPSGTGALEVLTVAQTDTGAWRMNTFNPDCIPLPVADIEDQPAVLIDARHLDPPLPPSFTCDGIVFPSGAAFGPGTAQDDSSAPAAALRDVLDADPALPATGWDVLVSVPGQVAFGIVDQAATPWRLRHVLVEATPAGWQATERGDEPGPGHRQCDLIALIDPDLGGVAWTLAKAPSPTGTALDVWVKGAGDCAGSVAGRIVPPTVLVDPERVIVTFGVRQIRGVQDAICQPSEPARYTVDLPGPLGQRDVLDGGVYPPVPVQLP